MIPSVFGAQGLRRRVQILTSALLQTGHLGGSFFEVATFFSVGFCGTIVFKNENGALKDELEFLQP
jgi:hypothetical protein